MLCSLALGHYQKTAPQVLTLCICVKHAKITRGISSPHSKDTFSTGDFCQDQREVIAITTPKWFMMPLTRPWAPPPARPPWLPRRGRLPGQTQRLARPRTKSRESAIGISSSSALANAVETYQVVAEELHDQGRVLIALHAQRVKLCISP